MKTSKTTEELAQESGLHAVITVLRYAPITVLPALETFRTLAIQNERDCAEPAAWAAMSEAGVIEALGFNQSKTRFDTPLFTFPPAPQPCASKKDAIEALDNMDDYARMQIGVDAIGPRKVLEDYINQPCPECEKLKAELRRIDMAFDDERINLTHTAEDLVKEQADEIAKLKEVIAKCRKVLQSWPAMMIYKSDEALAAIKEIEK